MWRAYIFSVEPTNLGDVYDYESLVHDYYKFSFKQESISNVLQS